MDNKSYKNRMTHIQDETVLVKEGDTCFEVFKIVSGKVAVYTGFGEKEEYLIGILPQGKFIGLESFFSGKPCQYTYITVTDSLLMRVDKDEIESFVRTNSGNAIEMLKALAESNYRLNVHVDMLNEELIEKIDMNKGQKIDLKRKLLESRYKLH